jgi:uncharacterized protein YbjT (DUF2867 family)
MADTKIIAVVGATGAQGGGLARAVLSDPVGGFAVRALTRDPDSERARELADHGAEVVRADLDEEDSVIAAFEGAYGAFLVTNYWEHLSTERERAQAGAMARAAKTAGIRHAIWSSLEDTREFVPLDDDRMPTLEGRYKVPHFDAKAEADALFTEEGVPVTVFKTTFFWENLLGPMGPQRAEGGRLVLSMPMAESRLAGIGVDDVGRTAFGVFKRGEEFIGRTVDLSGEHLTGAEMAWAFEKMLGEEVVYEPMAFEAMREQGWPGAADMANMFQFYAEFAEPFTGKRDFDLLRELNPELETFEDWLADHRESFSHL